MAAYRSQELARRCDAQLQQSSRQPTMICWGARDFVFDLDSLNEWRRRFPEAEVHTFAGAGHYLLEDAGEQIIPLVRDFLKRHPLPKRSTAHSEAL